MNLASGPCRDVAEVLTEYVGLNINIDCVEMDPNAITYAQTVLPPKAPVRFIQKNVFKFEADHSYDLIWSAGLFDYFDDAAFHFVLSRLLNWLRPGGELVIGNFQPNHGTYFYLIFVDWHLHQRTAQALYTLATSCQVPAQNIEICAEPLGANLFLHIRLPACD